MLQDELTDSWVNCFFLKDDHQYSGRVRRNGRRAEVAISEVEKFPPVRDFDGPFSLLLENGRVLSSLQNYVRRTTNVSSKSRVIYTIEIDILQYVIGPMSVSPEERFYEVGFKLSGVGPLISWNERLEEIKSSLKLSLAESQIFKFERNGLECSLWVGVSFSSQDRLNSEFEYRLSISKKELFTLSEIMPTARRVYLFFSLCLGESAFLSDCCLTTREDDSTGAGSDDNEVKYTNFMANINFGHTRLSSSTLLPLDTMRDRADADRFSINLSEWIGLSQDWDGAINGLSLLFNQTERSLPRRLLDACSWFEELPIETKSGPMNKDEIDQLVEELVNIEPTKLGPLRERVRGALMNLRNLSRKEIVSQVGGFGLRFSPRIGESNNLVGDAVRAFSLRGKHAHGHRALTSNQKAQEMYNSTVALETICLGYLYYNLPAPIQKHVYQQSHPAFEYFHLPPA